MRNSDTKRQGVKIQYDFSLTILDEFPGNGELTFKGRLLHTEEYLRIVAAFGRSIRRKPSTFLESAYKVMQLLLKWGSQLHIKANSRNLIRFRHSSRAISLRMRYGSGHVVWPPW